MATRVQQKRSSVAGNIPSPSDLEVGAFAVNFADRYIYTKNGASAVIRLTGHIPTTQPVANEVAGDSYIDPTTGKLYSYFSLDGDPAAWNEIAPAEDLTPFVRHDGSVNMTGPLVLTGAASGSQALGFTQAATMIATAVADYLKKDGSVTMTGLLTLSGAPVDDLHAATKLYVDTAVAIATPDLTAYLAKVGGVMTGQITLPGGGTGNQAATANELAAGLAAHVALPDPHTQYATNVELNNHIAAGASQHPPVTGSINGFMSSTDKTRLDTMVVAADAEVVTGTDNAKYVTPLRLKTHLDVYSRRKLIANTTLYVRTDGNDSNDGSADDSGHAFLTINKAIDVATTYDFAGFTLTIQVADGTYTTPVVIKRMFGWLNVTDFTIKGNNATPANVKISTTNADCITASGDGVVATIKDLQLESTTSGNGLDVSNYAHVKFQNLVFATLASSHINVPLSGVVEAIGSYSVTGSGVPAHITVATHGEFFADNITITFGGGITFSSAGVNVTGMSFLRLNSVSYSGSFTGPRYIGTLNSVLLGASTFPGSSAGATATGAQVT